MTHAEFNAGVKAQETALQRKGRLEFLREWLQECSGQITSADEQIKYAYERKIAWLAEKSKAEAEMLSLAGGMD